MSIGKNVLHAIGNTSLVPLRKVVPPGCANVLVKLEWENPTGSMKDRTAQAMISKAEEDGRLKPGDTIVEYTGGSTGISLALICVAKGYRLHIVTSDAFSQDKLNQMTAFGAELTLIPPRFMVSSARPWCRKYPPPSRSIWSPCRRSRQPPGPLGVSA